MVPTCKLLLPYCQNRLEVPFLAAHAVQTSLKHAFERTAAANNVLSKLKAIVKKFRKSKPVKEFFMQSQVDAGVQPKTLLQEVKSRWDSEEALFARAIVRKVYVNMLTAQPEHQLQHQFLTQYDWQIAETILPILGVVKNFTSWNQTRGPEAGVLLWKIMLLKAQLDAAPAPDLGGFKTELVNSARDQTALYEQDEGYRIAHVLDPRFKGV